jgi:hypothetical protein
MPIGYRATDRSSPVLYVSGTSPTICRWYPNNDDLIITQKFAEVDGVASVCFDFDLSGLQSRYLC